MSEKPPNRAERVLHLLTARYPGWVPAIELEAPGGRQAWRTAVSEARALAKAQGGDIENRTRTMRDHNVACNGPARCICRPKEWTLSEYRLKTADEFRSEADPVSVASEGHNTNANGHDTNLWNLR